MSTTSNKNPGVPHIPFFTPAHPQSPGTPAVLTKDTPTLFTPLKIRDVTLRNRIVVAPMCQYSTAAFGPLTGALTDYHIATLGHYALKGASLVMIEATGVQPNGRISPNCPGIWSDAQIPAVRRVSDFIKSQGALSSIQLAHAGRKSSTAPVWVSSKQRKTSARATAEDGGWPDNVVGPMGGESETWDLKGSGPEGGFYAPRQLSGDDIKELVQDWAKAAKRAVTAGIEVIEIHGAHGYLIHQFLSPITNRRTDQYGGSLENRTRLLFEIIKAIRAVIPSGMPLWLRLSATEWMENTELGKKYGSWNVEDTIWVAKHLPSLGVDLLDCSSGGNHPTQQIDPFSAGHEQVKIAGRIRKEVAAAASAGTPKLFIGAVGLITEAEQAKDIVAGAGSSENLAGGVDQSIGEEAATAVKLTEKQGNAEPNADVILIARQFMREPEWVLRVGARLGVDLSWPAQFLRVRFPRL
ncbi:NADH oxidase [Tothia fuscella]|uniref:NADH oxidase n=1 Tax=Tothia fuscella TaxID=1048955 RepID=A0A9P4TZL2_9PEZI|nr:NADH oxidase [Tothia fuscella]